IENLRDRLAAHSIVEQQHCIGPPCQARLGLPIPHQRDQVLSDARSKKSAANHVPTRIADPAPGKPFFRSPMESGYNISSLSPTRSPRPPNMIRIKETLT